MIRLLDATLELNNWAAALNMFTLWVVSAGVAALVFAFCARQPQPALIAEARPDDSKSLLCSARVTPAVALFAPDWPPRPHRIAANHTQ